MGSLCTLCGFWNFSAYKQNPRFHDDVIKWKHFPRHWPFVREIHRSPVNSPHKGQWRGALMFSLICTSTNGWANHRDDGDLRRHRAHYDVTVILSWHHDMQTLSALLALWYKKVFKETNGIYWESYRPSKDIRWAFLNIRVPFRRSSGVPVVRV